MLEKYYIRWYFFTTKKSVPVISGSNYIYIVS